jgi:hypothetical protein
MDSKYDDPHDYGYSSYYKNTQENKTETSSEISFPLELNWNQRFQAILDSYFEKRGLLGILLEEFTKTSSTIAKQIILERNSSNKTISPLGGSFGKAGGEKFICNGIFFKYAVDNFGFYGGDEWAKVISIVLLKVLNILFYEIESSKCGTSWIKFVF